MNKTKYLIALLPMLFSTSAFADEIAEAALKGKERMSYQAGQLCFACHGEDGRGLNSLSTPSDKWERSAPSFHDSKIVKDPERMILVLTKGIKQSDPPPFEYLGFMAGYGSDFSDEDLANVITFIRSEFGGFKELTTAAQVAEWRKKYVDVPGLTVIDKNGEDVLVGGLAREEIEQVNNPVKRTPAGQRKLIQIGGEEVAFRWCPPTGKNGFDMGSPADEELRDRDETQHRVVLTHGFWMMETEVTERLWKAVTGNAVDYRDSKKPPRTDFAVEQRTWDDCQKFISMVNASGALPEGLKAALPTEAQWEYACRAGTRTVFHFGDSLGRDQASIDGRSPYGGAKKRPFKPNPQPVRSYAANAWGLYDMHGGLWEWCADWYGPYISGLQTDPVGAETGPFRVLRGGSRESDARYCRSAFRGKLRPNDDSRAGFRLSLQLETP